MQTASIHAGQWFRMTTGPCGYSKCVAIAPTGQNMGIFGKGPESVTPVWLAVHEDGHKSEISAHSIGRMGIGGLVELPNEPDATADDIAALCAKGEQARRKYAQDIADRATAEEAERVSLPAKFPKLVPMEERQTKSSHAHGAGNIRRELKVAFPGVKFSVTSKSYSGGDSIDIAWVDGPTTGRVEKIVGKYAEGHFDGMDDSYSYSRDQFPRVFGGAKYVMTQRGMSLAGVRTAWAKEGRDLADIAESKGDWDRWTSKNGDDIFRAWAATDLM